MKNHWTAESWGADYPPENYEEILSRANDLIDAYAETHDEDETAAYSAWLWDLYTSTNALPMPYVFVRRSRDGDQFQDFFDTEREALDAAEDEWYHLTDSERKSLDEFCVGAISADPDCWEIVSGGWNGWCDVVREWSVK